MATLREYAEMLLRHDWYYAMSDSHGVYQAGAASMQTLIDYSKTSDRHMDMFRAGLDYHARYGKRSKSEAEYWASQLTGLDDVSEFVSELSTDRYGIDLAMVREAITRRAD